MIHPLSDVKSTQIGDNTCVWQFTVILAEAIVGDNCNINCHCFIENDVKLGNNVTIKSGVYLWDGITIHDDVFVGPNVTFTNDKFPRSKQYPSSFQKTILNQGCSIGGGSTILGGTTIGSYAVIGAGSLVTKDVPAFALVYGSPATIQGWVDKKGNKLKQIEAGVFEDNEHNKYQVINNELIKK
jgi:UDP-2-acetamido-3-amino-2,3-dideoxy-glucuronate N-acetyltransferase